MPDNTTVVIASERVDLPDIPLTEEALLAWIEAKKKEEAEAAK